MLTIAVGDPLYLELALTLARSFARWHRDDDIRFVLATDRPVRPAGALSFVEVLPLRDSRYGTGFRPKLYLNELAPAAQTLFVDADCLCTRHLGPVFDRLRGRPVGVVGRPISAGEWFGDVAAICARQAVPALPRFNGGIYYLEPGGRCDEVYRTAQALQSSYDETGFVRLRGQPNDEVLMALALARHGLAPVPDDGTLMNSTLAAPGGVEIDALRGRVRLRNPRSHPRHNGWYEMDEMSPALVHFVGATARDAPYRRERLRLERVVGGGWPLPLADLWSAIVVTFPHAIGRALRELLRPAYRRIFGYRRIARHASGR